MNKPKNIVVTGGSGRLGRYVVDKLKSGRSITVFDAIDPKVSDVNFVHGDVLDPTAIRNAFQDADAVVHLAAIPNPRTSSPKECFEVNVQGTWNVLEAAEVAGIKRVVVASSDSATGLHHNPENWPPQYLPVDEQHPLRPTEAYSLSKEVTESICRCFATRGRVEVMAIRPGHIVFEPEYPELEGRGADLHNYHLWGYVAAEDIALGFELALDHEDGSYDCIFIGAADGLNERPTLELFRERFGFEPEVRKPEIYEAMPTAGIFGISHARKKLGYEPQFSRADLLKRVPK